MSRRKKLYSHAERGRRGGIIRAWRLSKEELSAQGRYAVRVRWARVHSANLERFAQAGTVFDAAVNPKSEP